jgi:hypothetical protein
MKFGRQVIECELDAIIFNPISSTVLKWLSLKFVSWKHDFQPCAELVWDCSLLGYYGYITYNLYLMLLWQPLRAIYCRTKTT